MKHGPMSCSAAASRSPGRRLSLRERNSRAQAISAGAMPSVSSGNSASCRAKLNASVSSRQLLRSARNILETPARVQRHDTRRHVAPPEVAKARGLHAIGQLMLRREAADAFVQVAVRLRIAGDE